MEAVVEADPDKGKFPLKDKARASRCILALPPCQPWTSCDARSLAYGLSLSPASRVSRSYRRRCRRRCRRRAVVLVDFSVPAVAAVAAAAVVLVDPTVAVVATVTTTVSVALVVAVSFTASAAVAAAVCRRRHCRRRRCHRRTPP
eukprot:6206393-Pleurochrysis_carterae.AAC.1